MMNRGSACSAWLSIFVLVVGLLGWAANAQAQCTNDAQCHNDNNVCTCDRCVGSVCQHNFSVYGNVNCDLASLPNIDDIICVIAGFGSFASCPNGDIHPGCTGNNTISLDDILQVIAAFGGADPCNCATGIPCSIAATCDDGLFCNGAEQCVAGFCASGADPCPGQSCSEAGDVCTGAGTAVMTCELSASSAPRGTVVQLETFLESATSVRGYEVGLLITKLSGPGTLDAICPSGIVVDINRADYVFLGQSVFTAVDCNNERLAGALLSGGVNVTTQKYLGHFNLTISSTAADCTEFEIAIGAFPTSRLRDSANNNIPFVPGAVCTLQITGNSGVDCNGNTIPDECEADCQPNGVADECDLSGGGSLDCNNNDIPDECETDCQPNGIPDDCDIIGPSNDCNLNQVPDECEPNDCQPNGIPDDCDIAGPSTDCNANLLPDECDLALGVGSDCQPNGVFDLCDIQNATSQDFNSNGIPDECDLLCASGCGDNNVCTCDKCLNGLCSHTNRKYGDTNCSGGNANLDDILCTLAGFANIADCRNADIAPLCTGNGAIDLDDLLRVLSAFAGVTPCGCP